MATPLKIPVAHARRFQRRATGLDRPFPSVGAALDHLGFIQIDPMNICGRMHDLILRPRVAGYREGALHDHLYRGERPGYEHFLPGTGPVLAAFPIDAWPWLAARVRSRRLRPNRASPPLSSAHERLARHVLREIGRRGPLGSADFEHEQRTTNDWGGDGRLIKRVLDQLFAHGRILIAGRRHFHRRYDLPERVLPAAVLRAPEPPPADAERWLTRLKLRQRRLVRLTPAERHRVADEVQAIEVPGCPPLFCLRDDLALLDACARPEADSPPPRLLAPLDPLIYDRQLTARLWNFFYTWEAYTPAAKRVRGHYALPVLAGDELVGHVDPKADRAAGRLRVISRKVRRGHRVASALTELAAFLGLRWR